MNTGDFEMPKVFADLRRHLDEATRKLVRKYVLEVERLTEAQLADVIAQAIEAGDFIRHIRFDGAQSVVYIPYAEVERLKSRIAHLEERLRRYGIAEEEEPEV
jgi:BMFP domain-containing protein YqiC